MTFRKVQLWAHKKESKKMNAAFGNSNAGDNSLAYFRNTIIQI